MPEHARLAIDHAMLQSGLVPLFYHGDAAVTLRVSRACVVELADHSPSAYAVFTALAKQHPTGCIRGVGSVYDVPTPALFLAACASLGSRLIRTDWIAATREAQGT